MKYYGDERTAHVGFRSAVCTRLAELKMSPTILRSERSSTDSRNEGPANGAEKINTLNEIFDLLSPTNLKLLSRIYGNF